jgi:hypothetical protein
MMEVIKEIGSLKIITLFLLFYSGNILITCKINCNQRRGQGFIQCWGRWVSKRRLVGSVPINDIQIKNRKIAFFNAIYNNLYLCIPFAFLEFSIVFFPVIANIRINTITIKWDTCIIL